jgi:hypothetical protein
MADEEEAVAASVPPKAIEVIVKFSLGRPGFDLHPCGLPYCRLSEDEVHVRLLPAEHTAALPTAAARKSNRIALRDLDHGGLPQKAQSAADPTLGNANRVRYSDVQIGVGQRITDLSKFISGSSL